MTVKKECFVIAPIGDPNSDIRRRSDQIFKHIIISSVDPLGYKPIRADHISEPGIITSQVIQHLVEAPLVIADLTGQNPNVFYELAIRHATKKPLVQIIKKGEKVPFDILGTRTICVDLNDPDSVDLSKEELKKQIKSIEGKTEIDTPISVALDQKIKEKLTFPEIVHSGIKRVFKDRRHQYEEIGREMKEHILNSQEVLMLGISLRDFFGKRDNPKYSAIYEDVIAGSLERGVKFKVLLLDPTSEAAKDRAIIENGPIVADDEEYKKCALLEDILRVAKWIDNQPRARQMKIQVRFYDLTPSMFAIITRDFMFIEQYHMGRLEFLPTTEVLDKEILCLGGYVPLLTVQTSSNFAKLITDHFNNLWEKMEHNKLKNTIGKIEEFRKTTAMFRTKQFLSSFLKKAKDLRTSSWG